MKEKIPYSQIDLPKRLLPEGESHYKPLPDHFLRRKRAGSKVLNEQADGLVVASLMLDQLERSPVDDGGFSTRLIGYSALNSGWYTFARGSEVMHRNLSLPKLVDEDEGWFETRQGLVEKCSGAMASAAGIGSLFAVNFEQRNENKQLGEVLGRRMANSSLLLASLDVVDTTFGMDAFEAQDLARENALRFMEDGREIVHKIGRYPSMAQIGNDRSELTLYWRRKAPKASIQLLDGAVELLADSKGLFGKG